MGNIKLTEQDNRFILMNTLEKKEVINEDLVNVIKSTGFKGVAPFEIRTSRGRRVIITDLTGTYSILTRLQSPIDSRELLLILKGLLDSLKEVSSRKIPPTNIDLDLDYIFIRRDGTVLITLWALDGLAPKTSLPALLRLIGDEAKPNAKRDENFINGYLDLFDEGFSMQKLDKFVTSNYDMLKTSAMDENKKESQSKPLVSPAKAKSDDEPAEVEVGATEEGDVLVPTGKTTFLVDEDEDENDGRTALLTEEVNIARVIVRPDTGEKFKLDENELIIGKHGADIAITGNKAISRQHAKIVVFDGVVTIEDLGSSNGTKLNDKKLEVGVSEELVAGDTITLANEPFEYQEE